MDFLKHNLAGILVMFLSLAIFSESIAPGTLEKFYQQLIKSSEVMK